MTAAVDCPACMSWAKKVKVELQIYAGCSDQIGPNRRKAERGDRAAMLAVGEFYKAHGQHGEAGMWFRRLDLFPDFDFAAIPEE